MKKDIFLCVSIRARRAQTYLSSSLRLLYKGLTAASLASVGGKATHQVCLLQRHELSGHTLCTVRLAYCLDRFALSESGAQYNFNASAVICN